MESGERVSELEQGVKRGGAGRWRKKRARRKGVVLSPLESGPGLAAVAGTAGGGGWGWLEAAGITTLPSALPHATQHYKGEPVHVRPLPPTAGGELKLRTRTVDLLLIMQGLRHENVNPFLGVTSAPVAGLTWRWCGRGSLWRVLRADGGFLQWGVRGALLRDLLRGLGALHAAVGAHGRLNSRNCLVDARWTLRISDYCLPQLYEAQGLTAEERSQEDMLWSAPELVRGTGPPSVPGDVYSVGIILQEVILLDRPYCMLPLTATEIIEKIRRPPPLVRPWLPLSAGPPGLVSAARTCWAETPDLRPRLDHLAHALDSLPFTRKSNTVDSMFEMLEKYSYNLEEVVKQRTEQLELEKKKTENLLNRMLPRSVACRLVRGEGVPAEEFAAVTVCFADIVGFTAWAARCQPVQVVARLNDLYSRFDAALANVPGVYKVETIGDAYMVVGGAPCRSESHAEDAAVAALVLLREARDVSVRAGLASGPAAAGVVGRTMPRYCLFGDTVNTAARMESTGRPGRAQLSAATAARLTRAGGWRLQARGVLWIKGKGHMTTYWLLGTDKPLPSTDSEEVRVMSPQKQKVISPVTSDRTTSLQRRGHFERQQSYPSHLLEGSTRLDSSSSTDTATEPTPFSAGENQYCLQRQWSLERDLDLAVAAAAAAVSHVAPVSSHDRY